MEILRNVFGSLTSGVIRLLVAVGILAAAYFFIVKPVLHTTDHAIDSANKTFEKSFGGNGGLDDIGKTLKSVDHQVQVQIHRSFHSAKKHGNPHKLIRCIQRASGDVHKIQRCAVKF
jgi:hypothetical protein